MDMSVQLRITMVLVGLGSILILQGGRLTGQSLDSPGMSGNRPTGPGMPSVLLRRNAAPPVSEAPTSGGSSTSARRSSSEETEGLGALAPRTPTVGDAVPSPIDLPNTEQPPRSPTNVTLADSSSPSVRLELLGPPSVSVGKPARLELVASNPGSVSARELVIHIRLPGSLEITHVAAAAGQVEKSLERQILWKLSELAADGQASLELQVIARQEAPVELGIDWSMRSGLTTSIRVVKPSLQVAIHGPEEILYGTRQIYTISISNPGTGPAENVTLDVTSGGAGQGKRLDTIPPGGEQHVRMELVARDAGLLEIRATASADGLRQEATRRILVRRAELAVSVRGSELAYAGTQGIVEIEVANVGNATAQEGEISVRLPPGIRYLRGVDGAAASAGRLTWRVRGLAAGDRQTYPLEVAYEAPGEATVQVHAALPGEVPSTASLTIDVDAVADLKLEVQDPHGPQAVGQDVAYEIRVTNRGSKTAANVKLLGQFSRGIEPVRAEGLAAQVVPGQVIFSPIAQIEPGQTVTVRIIARAESAGNHRFRATLQSGEPSIELISEETTPFYARAASRSP